MFVQLEKIKHYLITASSTACTDWQADAECAQYNGYSFRLGKRCVIFRNAKITPKKTGQFVTLWKRNQDGITIPYDVQDRVDFFLIITKKDKRMGFFFFDKKAFVEHHILTHGNREGKRGFRLYSSWDEPESKQARQTQEWQSAYFIDMEGRLQEEALTKLRNILSDNS